MTANVAFRRALSSRLTPAQLEELDAHLEAVARQFRAGAFSEEEACMLVDTATLRAIETAERARMARS
jgi:hypothetical protein